ncbi:methionyl-tRNA formyltransferase-like protein [Podospora appendiculata]|uniref:methionyl-tRNA formyltransferase n=1 Tax=Podospora appendiculata TaxID=314037 RepID=A0AAE0X6D3_9PEZI|nr:methionyl-tRNA formyltransferase-like protein [Podospora appendiculata]
MLQRLFAPSLFRRTAARVSRPWPLSAYRCAYTYTYSTKSTHRRISDPLRILFCGSDEFSCESLKALHAAHARNADLIQSIDVVVRPAKPTGRGYKVLRESPLKELAKVLKLRVHERDTFTGWDMPKARDEPINLIIAVSFGLFVPPRLLRAAKYGGLNIHPSLLPDLRGPAPLHHALLASRTHTGVSLQTLSEKTFDAGAVLLQTPPPGIPIPPGCTVPQLHAMLAPLGGTMLVSGLEMGLHVPPHVSVVPPLEAADEATKRSLIHAPKVTSADVHVRWDTWTAADTALRARVIGALWTYVYLPREKRKLLRLILEGVEEVPEHELPDDVARQLVGPLEQQSRTPFICAQLPAVDKKIKSPASSGPGENETILEAPRFVLPYAVDGDSVIVFMPQGGFIRIQNVTLDGSPTRPAAARFREILKPNLKQE